MGLSSEKGTDHLGEIRRRNREEEEEIGRKTRERIGRNTLLEARRFENRNWWNSKEREGEPKDKNNLPT
jgi:hypothetical protein